MNKYQISKIKDQIYISKIKNRKIFDILYACLINFARNFLGVFFIFNILYLIFVVPPVFASSNYPIRDLGNCRDQKECKLYCDIPANTPACWSWGKYVMKAQQVLGETTINITYPIADLGNCSSAQECFLYCAQPKNQAACILYAKNNGLVKEDEGKTEDNINEQQNEQQLVESAKTELGCNSKITCMAFCNDPANIDKCRAFAKKHGLEKEHVGPPPEIMEKAKSMLGCDSQESCLSFCQKEENRERCFAFAKENKLIDENEVKRAEEMRENKKQMLEAAKTELGCDSFESCGKICSDPANREKCMNIGRKFGMVKEEVKPMSSNNMQKPCTSETECKKYCESHPSECPGFNQHQEQFSRKSQEKMQELRPAEAKPIQEGEFLGPTGCRTEDECRAYCRKHPKACPGFPTSQTKPIDSPIIQTQPVTPKAQIPVDYSPPPYPNKPPENYQPLEQIQNYLPPNPSQNPH